MISPLHAGIGGAASALLLGFGLYSWGHGNGKEAERLKWQTANVSVLARANDGLGDFISKLRQEAARVATVNANAADELSSGQTRIIERIREVPVEKVVTVSGECLDARISFGTVSLRNGWAAGDSVDEAAASDTAADLSDSIAGEVP